MKHGIRFWAKRAAVLLMAVSLLTVCTGCVGEYVGILKRLKTFQTCCTNADLDGMLDCVDPEETEEIRAGLKFVSGLFGKSDNELFQMAIGFLMGADSEDGMDLAKNYSVKLKKIKLDDGKEGASVQCQVNYENDSTTVQKDATIRMIKRGEDWYIQSFQFNH